MAANPSPDTCHICASSRPDAVLLLSSETRRGDGPWVFVRQDKAYDLCTGCHVAVARVSQAASTGGEDHVALGVPAGQAETKRAGFCDYCDAMLGDCSFGLDIVANRRRSAARMSKHSGTVVRQRICLACARWWIATMRDPSSLVGAGLRRLEGPYGGWLGDLSSDAVAAFLSKRDLGVLRDTLAAGGFEVLPLDALAKGGGHPIFLRAGRRDRARSLVASLGREARRVILVAMPDSIEDARKALLAGATDLLAEPLTPNQIAGALERLGSGWAHHRSSASGLPVLEDTLPASRFGLPATDLDFEAGENGVLANYLAVRKFVRGFDYVGVRHHNVAARVYAAEEDAEHIRDRLAEVLGVAVTMTPVAQELRADQAA